MTIIFDLPLKDVLWVTCCPWWAQNCYGRATLASPFRHRDLNLLNVLSVITKRQVLSTWWMLGNRAPSGICSDAVRSDSKDKRRWRTAHEDRWWRATSGALKPPRDVIHCNRSCVCVGLCGPMTTLRGFGMFSTTSTVSSGLA